MSKRTNSPVIGLTLDHEPTGGYSRFPWYAMRENYFTAITRAGGLPIALPHYPERVTEYLTLIDGLVVTGGAFDVDPALFGAKTRHHSVTTKNRRTQFELAVIRAAHRADIPVLGICGGQQLMNVALGGTLIQHIPDAIPNALAHEQPNSRDEAGHSVSLTSESELLRITQRARMEVNSAHHQAVEKPAPSFTINALAPDGVIEGIEDVSRRWFIGVQWHPEFAIDPGDLRLFESFLVACQE